MDTPTLAGTGFVLLAGFLWVYCAVLAYQTAPKFGRGALTWGILGIIIGPIALFALYLLPHHHVEARGRRSTPANPRTSSWRLLESRATPRCVPLGSAPR